MADSYRAIVLAAAIALADLLSLSLSLPFFAPGSVRQEQQLCHFREFYKTAIAKFWHLTYLKLPNSISLAANLFLFLATPSPDWLKQLDK